MNKNILFGLFICCVLSFIGCEDENETFPDIQVGEDINMNELYLNKNTEKKILLSGGNGKYIVNVENSRIVSASISLDTLKVSGLLEGETFATILSHDKKKQLKICITYPELSISHTSVQLVPQEISQYISISGGGELVTLKKDDPAGVVDMKWDYSTGILELYPNYEGKASITAISQDGNEKKTIQVRVKPKGEVHVPGWYTTSNQSYYSIINNRMIVKSKKKGTWIFDSTRPNDKGSGGYFPKTPGVMLIAPTATPVLGNTLEVEVVKNTFKRSNIEVGKHQLLVDEINDTNIHLLGKGVKLLLPYKK